MKMCADHWKDLKEAIDARGLSGFIGDAKRAHQIMVDSIESPHAEAAFDPLLNANFAIWSNATRLGGLYMMTQKPDGYEYCPVCEWRAHLPEAVDPIVAAADEQLEKARSLGLVPPVQ